MTGPHTSVAAADPAADAPLIICEHCDTVYRRRTLARGETARCLRCNAVLQRHQKLSLDALFALVITVMVVFVLANAWPIMTFGLNGHHIESRLWGVIVMMWERHAELVSVLAAFTLFFCPLIKMLALGWVLAYARAGRRAPGFRGAMVILHYIGPWTMSEVFVLGVLVSIVKAKLYFDVITDPGVWAYAALAVCITIFSGVDVRRLWDEIPERPA